MIKNTETPQADVEEQIIENDEQGTTDDDQDKKPTLVSLADTGSDVDMSVDDIETVRHKIDVNISLRPNKRLGFARAHPKFFAVYTAQLKNVEGKTQSHVITFSDDPVINKKKRDELREFATIGKTHFCPIITPYGEFGFWNRAVPFGISKPKRTHITAHALWERMKTHWTQGIWNSEDWAWEYDDAPNQSIFPTDEELELLWPDPDKFHETLSRGLKQSGMWVTDLKDNRVLRTKGVIK